MVNTMRLLWLPWACYMASWLCSPLEPDHMQFLFQTLEAAEGKKRHVEETIWTFQSSFEETLKLLRENYSPSMWSCSFSHYDVVI